MPEDILSRIVEKVRRRLDERAPLPDLAARAAAAVEARRKEGLRSLAGALAVDGPAVIAECKQASPSAGSLRVGFDPVVLARRYAGAGAAAVSVVTEPDFFHGDPGWLPAVRAAVPLPVLRKDFVVCERQLEETAVAGADAVLLINRLLDADTLARLLATARRLHLEVLLELFCDEDPTVAVASGAGLLGVNARNLATFAVDLDAVARFAARLPADRLRVAESGVRGRADVERLAAAGYDAFLVGEHLVRADDPGAALAALLGRSPAG